ncbi:MAG TPA: hypothetical protein VNO33_15615 [Kofleriaceae bacterium]|nr:hypothetical protein [Kofleriaceae bacterium]
MFSIELIQDRPPIGRGRIRIGGFEEEFEVSLEHWSGQDYERQWLQALEGLLSGGEKTALIASMTDPQTANFLFWWPAYADGEDVVFQNGVLFMDELTGPFDPSRCDEFVLPREQVSETGDRISEWRAPAADVRQFIASARRP